MRRLVGQERHLREEDAQPGRDEQLEPRVAQEDRPGQQAGEEGDEARADERVEPGRAAQQPSLADGLGDLQVGLGQGRERLGARVACAGRGAGEGGA